MAGDWIKIENVTPEKPEVLRIAEEVGIEIDAVLGKLMRLWIWADNQTIIGNAPSVTVSVIDRIAGVPGFALAMQKFGWLKLNEGGAEFPNFDRHNGKTAKTRALTHRRVTKSRNADSVTDALPEKRRGSSAPQKTREGEGKSAAPIDSGELGRLARLFEDRYDGPKLRPGETLRQFRALAASDVPLSKIESEITDTARDPTEYPRVLAKRVRDGNKGAARVAEYTSKRKDST